MSDRLIQLSSHLAAVAAKAESKHADPAFPGMTGGKTAGTRLEIKKCCERRAE